MIDEKKIIDTIDCGIILLDRRLNIHLWNEWMEIQTKKTKYDVIGKKIDEVIEIDKNKIDSLKRNVAVSLSLNIQTFMTSSTYSYLIKIPLSNLFLSYFSHMQQDVKIVPFDRERGVVAVFISDKTLSIEAERMAIDNESMLKSILDSQESMVLMIKNNKITHLNHKFLSFFGYKEHENYIEKFAFVENSFLKRDGCYFKESDEFTPPFSWIEEIFQKKISTYVCMTDLNNDDRYFLVKISNIINDKTEYVVVFVDTTLQFIYQKELERKVKEESKARIEQESIIIQQSKQAMLGEMIGAISHQMKQPLNIINILSYDVYDICKNENFKNAHLVEYNTEKIMEQVSYTNETINLFRDFLKPASNDIGSKYFDVIKSIKESLRLFGAKLSKLNVNIVINIETNHKNLQMDINSFYALKNVKIYANGTDIELKQLLLNLISNTQDALEEIGHNNKKIEIDIINNGKYIIIKFRDNAGGIKEDIIKNIFQPYKTTKGEKGTGIGLYMSQQIVNRMDGDISVINIENGCEFTIKLHGVDEKAFFKT